MLEASKVALLPCTDNSPMIRSAKPAPIGLPDVTVSSDGDTRYLHLGSIWVQGSMRIGLPFDIDLEYVQRMMAWLLFVPDASPAGLARLHAMQLGLGAATATKFCHKRLKMRATAVELNPQVVAACRTQFKLPADDAGLHVVLADAALEVKNPRWQSQIDTLQVDLYDHEASGPVLDSPEFYADCHGLLTHSGVMTVNLFGRSADFARSVARISAVFGAACVWVFRPTKEGNAIVLGLRTAQKPDAPALAARAQTIEARYKLPASKWLRVLKPVAPAVL